jgi:hypothetical protein
VGWAPQAPLRAARGRFHSASGSSRTCLRVYRWHGLKAGCPHFRPLGVRGVARSATFRPWCSPSGTSAAGPGRWRAAPGLREEDWRRAAGPVPQGRSAATRKEDGPAGPRPDRPRTPLPHWPGLPTILPRPQRHGAPAIRSGRARRASRKRQANEREMKKKTISPAIARHQTTAPAAQATSCTRLC